MQRTTGKKHIYKRDRIIAAAWTAAVCLAAAALLFLALGRPLRAAQDTMAPAIRQGDVLILGRYSFYLKSPARGDIAAYREEAVPGGIALRRVVALPGESVACRDGQVYIGGVLLDESAYADRGLADFDPFTVPDGCVYLLPDVRDGLNDIGALIKITSLIGRVNIRTSPIGNTAIF